MNDLIRRADAIEAVASADVTNGTVKVFSGLEVIDILKALPSAEGGDAEMNEVKSPYMKPSPNGADLISRADAIEAVTDIQDGSGQRYYLAVSLVDKIRSLPSAEAEQVTSKLKSAEAVQGWIPCSERLPIVSGEFLVTLVDNDGAWVSTAQWNMTFGGRWQDIFPNDGYRDISNVIAWKTLPTPYTKGDNDEKR